MVPGRFGVPPMIRSVVTDRNSGHGRRRLMARDQLVNAGLQPRQAAFDPCALLGAKAVKRLGHEIIAYPLARQGALDSLDYR